MKIILTKRDTLISNSIAKFTNSSISHVACLLSDGDTIVEARGDSGNDMVVNNSLLDILADPKMEEVWMLTPKAYTPTYTPKCADKWLLSTVGTRYDFVNTAWIQLLRIFGLKSYLQRKDKQGRKKYQCAELGADACKLFVNNFPHGKPISAFRPSDFMSMDGIFDYKRIYKRAQ
jgi:hypothetical protein